MAAPHIYGNDLPGTSEPTLDPGPSPIVKIVSIALALCISAGLLVGFLIWRGWHESKVPGGKDALRAIDAVKIPGVNGRTESPAIHPALPVKVEILLDEPVRKGTDAVIGGTIRNISNERLSGLAVEFQLFHRVGPESDVRVFELDPRDLEPGQAGRYSATLSGDYRSLKLLRIMSAAGGEAIGFNTAPGARRPVAQPETKTVVVGRPAAPRKGDDFINTPDNPAKIP